MPLNLSTNNNINYILITPSGQGSSGILRIGDTSTTGSMLSITSIGNIGIGNTNPSYQIDVTGSINVTGTIYKNGVEFQGGEGGGGSLSGNVNSINVTATNSMIADIYTGGTMQLSGNITTGSFYLSSSAPRLSASSNNFIVASSGNVGIGTATPTFNLQLSTDSAAKPNSNYWTIGSDERLKTNITLANLDTCYNTVKDIPLKRYTWREDIYNDEQITDRNKIGWIAQDVQPIFPKAVTTVSQFDLTDCKTLDIDQIVTSMYGCLQKLMQMNTTLKNEIENLKGDVI